jgi:hypothetical protein
LNVLGRITARWLVGLLAVLTVLAHVSEAGRTARAGFDLGPAFLSSADPGQSALASEAPQGEFRFKAHDRRPHFGGKAADHALPSTAVHHIPPGGLPVRHAARGATPVRSAFFVPGQRAPPRLLPTA